MSPNPKSSLIMRLLTSPLSVALIALIFTGLLLRLIMANVWADVPEGSPDSSALWVIISLLLGSQTLLIIELQRSRLSNQGARKALKTSQRELEPRILEPTNSSEISNAKLQDEIIRHEATVLLLRETQDYLHSMLNAMPSVIIGVTHAGQITHWNTAAENNTGISAELALGQALQKVYPSQLITHELIAKTIAAGTPYNNENLQEGQGDAARFIDLTIYPVIAVQGIGAVIRVDEVTEKIKLKHMMIQNEKMLSLGELAAGIAHEINNPIGAILHNVQNIIRRTSPSLTHSRAANKNQEIAQAAGSDIDHIHTYLQARDIYKFLADIKEAGERSAKIVTNMLEFSHASQGSQSFIDLKNVIERSIELSITIGNTLDDLPHAIQVCTNIHPDLPKVRGKGAELQQVILNLLRNARQALASDKTNMAPLITVAAYPLDKQIIITIKDNGPGIPAEVKKHIFEPFYTTKAVGKGTGLGLSVSYFIITEHHQGRISVASTLGEGTIFTITLPSANATR